MLRLFHLLFFLAPFVFFDKTSELFEFNKMVLVYLFTVLIVGVWVFNMLRRQEFYFKRTPLDIPLVLFLASQVLSTIFSIDRTTSLFGYYSRFHGGLLSTISFLLLYWAFVSNINKKQAISCLKVILISGISVGIWGALEHFGKSPSCLLITQQFDTACWVQDVQHRVFATIGQPNWLAAWLVAILPLTWAFIQKNQNKSTNSHWQYHAANLILFSTLLFTKSRSAILGFVGAYGLFWLSQFSKKKLLLVSSYLILAALLIGTPWTSSLLVDRTPSEKMNSGPALESGGTESGTLRKIVWQGALDLVKSNPLIGTGVETFAYTYYWARPVEHNLTSEWDFLYNKAHNEYLHIAANTGLFGLISYLSFVGTTLYLVFISKVKDTNIKVLLSALASALVGLQISQFFGFSVVITSLQIFLYPAIIVTLLGTGKEKQKKLNLLPISQKFLLISTLLAISYGVLLVGRYWYADVLFAAGRSANKDHEYALAQKSLTNAIVLNPHSPNYYDELAQTYTAVALALNDSEPASSVEFIRGAIEQSDIAMRISPYNVNLAKSRANLFTDLSMINSAYLHETINTLKQLKQNAPTDPSVYHRLGLALATLNNLEEAVPNFQKAIELKPNYARARSALAYIYQQLDQKDKAREQLEYILQNIAPDDESVKEQLQSL